MSPKHPQMLTTYGTATAFQGIEIKGSAKPIGGAEVESTAAAR